jgi:inner membrane protein
MLKGIAAHNIFMLAEKEVSVDSISHALIIIIILVLIGRPDLALYGILGAVLIDIDAVFNWFSNRDPRLYIFTHGGFTHSFSGVLIISLLAATISLPVSVFGPAESFVSPFGPAAFAAILAGALSHITIDYLAYPGIPLFYPISDKKYTLGILGGPSGFIMLFSVVFIVAVAFGYASIYRPWPYIALFVLILALSAMTKAYAVLRTKGRTIATMNPLSWLVIEDTPDAYRFYRYNFLSGRSPVEYYEKYKGIGPAEAQKNNALPELKRLRYHSYIVTVEKDGDSIIYRDPIRENKHIWYPPYFKNYSVPVDNPLKTETNTS